MTAAIAPADVCIVGAGPAGLTAAQALSACGRSVVLLESGDARSSRRDQALGDGDHEGDPYPGLRRTRHRGIGGTSRLWNGRLDGERGAKYVPLSARDLVDWPIGWKDLEPFYREAQAVCGLGPFSYDADAWATPLRRPFDLDGTGLVSGVFQLGASRRFTRELPRELAARENVRLVPSTTAVDLVVDRTARRVCGVRAVDASGSAHEVRARAVVLACGAVENARVPMLAGVPGGGGSRWLGRGFMEHARDPSIVLVPDDPGLFAEAGFYDQHVARGVRIVGRIGPDDALARHGLPNASLTLFAQRVLRGESPRERVARSLRRALGARRSAWYGWSRVRRPATAFDAFRVVLSVEQDPDPHNRITLSPRRDRLGNPLPHLTLRWDDRDQARLERLRELLRDGFRSAGIGRLVFEEGGRPDLNAHHHMGTTRMAADAADGVVDADGRVFGTDGLYVAGASVFPRAGFANPTLTVVALARRLARHLDAVLG